MSYSLYDFVETLHRVEIKREDIARVIAGYGVSGDYAEWSGGFWLLMHDGRTCIIEGWCDTTGWGCQDGATVDWFDAGLKRIPLDRQRQWEHDPEDLNLWLKEGDKK